MVAAVGTTEPPLTLSVCVVLLIGQPRDGLGHASALENRDLEVNCGGMECRGAVLWLRGPTASCAKGLDGTVQTDQLRWLAAPTTGAVLSCSSVVDSSAVFGFVGQRAWLPFQPF